VTKGPGAVALSGVLDGSPRKWLRRAVFFRGACSGGSFLKGFGGVMVPYQCT
jgi:hypothetical protein